MDSRNLEESLDRLKNSINSNNVQQDRKTIPIPNQSPNFVNSMANNTNPIVCAVCGSKEYITVHSAERGHGIRANMGWNSAELPKKGSFSTEFGQSCGPLSLLSQTIFPNLSLLHFPNLYYSHYNSNLRFSSNPCIPIDRYYGESSTDFVGSKTSSINSESTVYREGKKKSYSSRINRDLPLGKEDSHFYKNSKDDSRPQSAFTNVSSDIKNYPSGVHPPWMGNIYPVFPYTYAPLAFPLNQPFFPVYLPLPAKWQNIESRNEEENADKSVLNCPIGDASSAKREDKQLPQKEETNQSEFDFEVIARELILERKSNYDEDENDDDEINIDEITSSLKIPQVDPRRETKPEKSFNSSGKWMDSQRERSPEKDEDQNWRHPPEFNMQDCCIRPLSNENLWYDASCEKKSWNSVEDFEHKNKHEEEEQNELDETAQGNTELIDGGLYEEERAWSQNRGRAHDDLHIKGLMIPKRGSGKLTGRPKLEFANTSGIESSAGDKSEEWVILQNSNLNEKIERSNEDISALADPSRLKEMTIIKNQSSKFDIQYNGFGDDKSCRNHGKKIILSEEDDASENMQASHMKDNPVQYNRDKINEILSIKKEKILSIGLTECDIELSGEVKELGSEFDHIKQNKSGNATVFDKCMKSLNKYEKFHGERIKKLDYKSSGLSPRGSLFSNIIKIKKDEKPKSYGYSSRNTSVKIPVAIARKNIRRD